ncbi:MAG: UvrB/UvrC motif-containing protein [candidate division Zixibacteria bacterium]|nr:UvrB/UvrC motif-containing protein [candidate division Zixibacteria bacterium]
MLCQECKKKESSVHLTQIVNDQKLVLNLCQDCAEKKGFHNPFWGGNLPLGDMLSNLSGSKGTGKDGTSKDGSATCPGCGMVFSDFAKLRRFGCGQCYSAFRPQLTKMLASIHGTTEHKGQLPQAATTSLLKGLPEVKQVKKEEQLQKELKKAIAREDFEKAAEIRDKLKTITEANR